MQRTAVEGSGCKICTSPLLTKNNWLKIERKCHVNSFSGMCQAVPCKGHPKTLEKS